MRSGALITTYYMVILTQTAPHTYTRTLASCPKLIISLARSVDTQEKQKNMAVKVVQEL